MSVELPRSAVLPTLYRTAVYGSCAQVMCPVFNSATRNCYFSYHQNSSAASFFLLLLFLCLKHEVRALVEVNQANIEDIIRKEAWRMVFEVTGDFHYLRHSLSYTTFVKSIQMTLKLPLLQIFVTNIVGRRIELGRSFGGWSCRSLVTKTLKIQY